jgi:formylglycine-generating enzyme required for sulfatase activity
MKGWLVLLSAAAAALVLMVQPPASFAAAPEGLTGPKEFRDCAECPVMVRVPAGTFRMGQDTGQARADERPVHKVNIRSFAAGRTEVTRAEFAAYVRETGNSPGGPCTTDSDHDGRWADDPAANWMDPGVPTSDQHPVTCVNWADAIAYTDWLSAKTGKRYRLLSEAEWEYAERAGSTTEYWWGDDPAQMCRFANGPDLAAGRTFPRWFPGANCDDGHDFAAPVASYAPNAFGLYDTAGNAWELTADCYAPYTLQPADGTPTEIAGCPRRALKGGSWVRGLVDLRTAQRNGLPRPKQRGADIGFRVARDL